MILSKYSGRALQWAAKQEILRFLHSQNTEDSDEEHFLRLWVCGRIVTVFVREAGAKRMAKVAEFQALQEPI